ncbi:S1C family serine protease [Pseudonocardia thermophila]|jgi:Trypsin-like serine proteases, typically periplasmic, contain C-terminal PDZ domain|uniref:S1C family serine protease n=1 Tax=Pseudonocardia thermophila TaxID=1848 RepID=UPI00248E3917|nr:trypsin-like peptidase domain-containing protein [Pseudonocardia thermophila]
MRSAEAEPANDQGPPAPSRAGLRRRRAVVIGVVVALVALLLGTLAWRVYSTPDPPSQADVDRAVAEQLERAREQEAAAPPEGALAYQAIAPSLVTVTARKPGETQEALGTGVVVNAAGAVLTALHVVDGAEQIQLSFGEDATAEARIVNRRPDQDIAVLIADRPPAVLVPAVLAGPPPIGDQVFAVGNPLGLRSSISAGVVSGLDRTITAPNGVQLTGLIQFDAAVNPGSSGGPLINSAGQVVGIVTGLANPAGGETFSGIGFAVPIATAGGAAGGPQQ